MPTYGTIVPCEEQFYGIRKQFDLYGWNYQYALKGQKLLAQGNALGIIAISKAPCKGKSFKFCLEF